MWKVKLDDDVWLSEDGTTSVEEEARLFPDMPSVQVQLKEVRRFTPYPKAMVIYDDGQAKDASSIPLPAI